MIVSSFIFEEEAVVCSTSGGLLSLLGAPVPPKRLEAGAEGKAEVEGFLGSADEEAALGAVLLPKRPP